MRRSKSWRTTPKAKPASSSEPRAHHLLPEANRALGSGRQQRRLAYSGAAFDHENAPLDQHGIQGSKLVLSLE
jgi:hypothetical protein